MKTIFILLMLVFTFGQSNAYCTEDMEILMDEFYYGLADVIETNMENPDKCLEEVDVYYKKNKKTVEKIRKLTKEYVTNAIQMVEEYDLDGAVTTEEEIPVSKLTETMQTEGARRYTEAIEKFATKYPEHGAQIALKASQFMPELEEE